LLGLVFPDDEEQKMLDDRENELGLDESALDPSEDEEEDDLADLREFGPPSIAAADAAAQAGLPAPVGGLIQPRPDAPAFEGHQSTTARLVQDLLAVGVRGNLTENTQEHLFMVLQQHLPPGHNFPSYYSGVQLLHRKSREQLREYPACPNDCHVFMQSTVKELASMKELAQLRCPDCAERISQPGMEPRVNLHATICCVSNNLLSLVADKDAYRCLSLHSVEVSLDGTGVVTA
jgi:hypothetical protein